MKCHKVRNLDLISTQSSKLGKEVCQPISAKVQEMRYVDRNFKQYDRHTEEPLRTLVNTLGVWNMFCVEEPAFACCTTS
jgi:hypothetical protein